MGFKPKQSWVCGISCGCAFLMIYTYCVLYSYQWDTKVYQTYDYVINITRVSFNQNFLNNDVTTQERSSNDTVLLQTTIPSTDAKGLNLTRSVNTNFWKRENIKLGLMSEEEYMAAKEVNRARQLLLQKACQKFKTSATNVFLDTTTHAKGNFYQLSGQYFLPQSPDASSFQVDWADEVVFCWQYKVGSTAWNALFANLLNQTNIIRTKTFYDMREVMTVKNRGEMKKALKFYRFMVVRHPFERLLSAYRDRIEDTTHRSWQRDHFAPKIFALTRPHLKRSEIKSGNSSMIPSFSEFVEYLLKTHMNHYDPHWAPFWKHCVPCVVDYDAIGKRETQALDGRFILEESGLATEANLKILEENAHQGRGDTKKLMLKYYSTLKLHTLEQLYRRYEVDFFLFGYDVQPLLDELFPAKNISFISSFV